MQTFGRRCRRRRFPRNRRRRRLTVFVLSTRRRLRRRECSKVLLGRPLPPRSRRVLLLLLLGQQVEKLLIILEEDEGSRTLDIKHAAFRERLKDAATAESLASNHCSQFSLPELDTFKFQLPTPFAQQPPSFDLNEHSSTSASKVLAICSIR